MHVGGSSVLGFGSPVVSLLSALGFLELIPDSESVAGTRRLLLRQPGRRGAASRPGPGAAREFCQFPRINLWSARHYKESSDR
jgi:hypothetical protein